MDLLECLHQPVPDFKLSEVLFREENCRSAVVPTCLVFKIAFNEADNTVFCFTCRKMFKEKKNKT